MDKIEFVHRYVLRHHTPGTMPHSVVAAAIAAWDAISSGLEVERAYAATAAAAAALAPDFVLEAGKCYRLRNGSLTGPLRGPNMSSRHLWTDGVYSWTAEGRYLYYDDAHFLDIVGPA